MGLFSRTIVGIDIGHASVKVVGVSVSRRPRVVGFADVPVDTKYLAKEGTVDPALVAQALQQAMRTAFPRAIHAQEAYASVSEGIVFRKILEVPISVTIDEMANVVRAEVVEYLPDDIANLEIDYQILGELPGELQQVMVVAVDKKVVSNFLEIAKLAKLKLKALDPKPSAVGRAIVLPRDTSPVILVDIGAQMTSISIYAQHAVWVTGSVNMGSDTIRNPETGELDPKKEVKLERLVDGIVDELTHVVKFYQNRASGEQEIKQIRLSGGGALLEGVVVAIKNQVKQEVLLGSPILPLPQGADSRFIGALGCALYTLYDLV